MAEYWKSTPKYWCKHCNTYVRDTKLEKANHEATPKHQGNLKRFLRDLHRGHEKDEKDKERAKAEVARLNSMATSSGAGSSAIGTFGLGRGSTPSLPKAQTQATPAQRKQQLAQLSEMGISIPDGFKPDLAMAGEWQVTSERIIEPDGEKKPDSLALGVRKRAVEDDEDGAGETESKKRRWGSTYKTHPTQGEDVDLDALLNNMTRNDKGPIMKHEDEDEKKDIKIELESSDEPRQSAAGVKVGGETLGIKNEPSEGEAPLSAFLSPFDDGTKQDGEEQSAPGVVFKKRKARNIRQK